MLIRVVSAQGSRIIPNSRANVLFWFNRLKPEQLLCVSNIKNGNVNTLNAFLKVKKKINSQMN